jgi:L-seryl-tRNA(Ser) seleniumtransferase
VALFAQRGDSPSDTGVSITPYMLLPGDAQIVADRLAAVLAHPTQRDAASPPKSAAADLSGHWDCRSSSPLDDRTMPCTCDNKAATSTVHTPAISCPAISPARSTATPCASTAATTSTRRRAQLHLHRQGDRDSMSGTLDMGEYLMGTWTAARHDPPRG